MGNCASGKSRSRTIKRNIQRRRIYLQERTIPIATLNQKIVKVIHGKFTGKGVKKTIAYQCRVTEEELKKHRKQFWNSRDQGRPETWKIIRTAAESSPEEAKIILESAGLLPCGGIMTCVYSPKDDHSY